jgi:hypothetical protein
LFDEFDLSDIDKCDNRATLLKQVENRQFPTRHQRKLNVVKTYIESYPLLNRSMTQALNQSALITALKENQYEHYALLQSVFCTKNYLVDQIKKDEMARACSK